jgi:DNA repair protein RadD
MSTLPLFPTSPLMAFTPPTLRPYQKSAIELLRKRYEEGRRRMILVAPCASGKMFMVAAIIRGTTVPALFVAHRKELIDQCYRELERQGLSHIGVMRGADERIDPSATIQVASIQTLARRNKPKAGLIFIDECHRSAGDQFREHIFDAYPDAIIIGLTATPTRLDGKPLGGDLFQTLDVVATYEDLISKNWLSAPVCYGWPPPDLSAIPVSHGDFVETPLSSVMSDSVLVGDVVEHWVKHANLYPDTNGKLTIRGEYRRTFCFAVDIAHSKAIVARFKDSGVAEAEHLDGTTPEHERDAMLRALAEHEIDIISNCNVLLEGIDIPSAKCVIHARPTQSIVLFRQSCARIFRPWCEACKGPCGKHPYVVPLILDHGGSYDRHGSPTEDLAWQLKSKVTRYASQVPEKRCTACGLYVLAGKYICPHCGFEFDMSKDPGAVKEEVKTELALKDPELVRRAYYDKMVAIAMARGYKPGFASAKFKERYAKWPPKSWGETTQAKFASDLQWQEGVEYRRKAKEAMNAEPSMDVGADPAGLAGDEDKMDPDPPAEELSDDEDESLSGWLREQGIQ